MQNIIKLKRPRRTLRYTTHTCASYGAVVAARIRKVASRIDTLDRAVRGESVGRCSPCSEERVSQ